RWHRPSSSIAPPSTESGTMIPTSSTLRATLRAAALVAASLLLSSPAVLAQSGQVKIETLRSEADGHPIHISYFPAVPKSGGAENAPVVILLHGKDGDRLVWEQKGAGKTGKSFA